MRKNDNDGAFYIDDRSQPGVAGQGKDRPHVVRGADKRRRDNAGIGDETAVLNREKSAAAREDAADLRTPPICVKRRPPRANERFVRSRRPRQRLTITCWRCSKPTNTWLLRNNSQKHKKHEMG